MSAEENIAIVRRLIARGFSEGAADVVDEVMVPGCIEHQRGNKPGAEGAKQVISTLHTWFSEFELTIEDITARDDMVWSRNVARGVNTGSIMGFPPTGKSVQVDVFDVVRLENGKVVEHWGVADQLGLLMQLGLLPRPQSAPTR
jgi:predicted ester cyclase